MEKSLFNPMTILYASMELDPRASNRCLIMCIDRSFYFVFFFFFVLSFSRNFCRNVKPRNGAGHKIITEKPQIDGKPNIQFIESHWKCLQFNQFSFRFGCFRVCFFSSNEVQNELYSLHRKWNKSFIKK